MRGGKIHWHGPAHGDDAEEMRMTRKVVIFGTGDYARVASVYLDEDSPFRVVAFSVHQEFMGTSELLGRPVVPFEQLPALYPPGEHAMLVAMGYRKINKARAQIYDTCKALGYELISYVSTRASVSKHVVIGDNCFIFENNVLQPFVRIGNDVVLWSGNHIGHDSSIGDHCFIASHAVVSGNVKVGDHSFIGVNATLRDGVSVGPQSVIGAGALVLKDVPAAGVVRGTASEVSPVPSHRLKAI